MYPSPSLEEFCCSDFRPTYGEERRNISMARSTLGPFPDEWILSGLDRILYFCGIKNVCELVEKFPINSECRFSSSSSVCDSNGSSYTIDRSINRSCKGSSSDLIVRSSDNWVAARKAISAVSLERLSEGHRQASLPSQTELLKQLSKHSSLTVVPDLTPPSSNRPATILSSSLIGCENTEKKKFSIKLKVRKACPKKLPKIVGTKWAMARINIFNDCSRTYEILEIKGKLPRGVIPCRTAVFFAVLPDGSSICFDYIKPGK